jgi:putative transposase
MPRTAREKAPECVYHIICRSVSEFLLFRENEDKDYYLKLLKRYTNQYQCSIYGYCLMDNHLHLQLDPKGFDISKFMHSTNTAYVRYYNKKYKRHGHVFQERFESRILTTDEYNLVVSAYIHNNPKDIEGYNGREHLYQYSSYGIYLGIARDELGLVDISFIMGLFNETEKDEFSRRYGEFARHQSETGISVKIKEKLAGAVSNEYRDGRRIILREQKPSRLTAYISDKLLIASRNSIILKSKQRVMEFRALCAYSMRTLCGLGYREICGNMYNISISGCARLCSKGYALICENAAYAQLFDELANLTTC